MSVSLLAIASPLSLAISFFSIAFFGFKFCSTIVQTLAVNVFPSSTLGSAIGLMGTSGSFGVMFFNYPVGSLLAHYHSHLIVLTLVERLLPMSFIVISAVVREIKPVKDAAWSKQKLSNPTKAEFINGMAPFRSNPLK